jgi:hypothetical protein
MNDKLQLESFINNSNLELNQRELLLKKIEEKSKLYAKQRILWIKEVGLKN